MVIKKILPTALLSKLKWITLAVLLMVVTALPCYAMWYGENVGSECDIIMMDIRWPYWTESTYYAHWNSAVVGDEDSFSFYGGYLSSIAAVPPKFLPDMDPEKQDKHTLGSNWAFWGTNKKTGEPPRVIATSRFNYPHQYIGEGGSSALYGDGWRLKRNQWYTMILRLWSPLEGQDPGYCYIGRWTKDVRANHWYLYGVIKIPTEGKYLRHNAGFMEDFGHGARSVRSIHRRFGYYRENGEWKKSDVISLNLNHGDKDFGHNCVATTLEDDQVFAIEWCISQKNLPVLLNGLSPLELGKTHTITVKQPYLPEFDRLIIKGVTAKSTGDQVIVSWTIPPESAPQFAYKVEVFDNQQCSGKPLAVRQERMPIVRNVLLSAKVQNPTVRLSVVDIFDHSAKPIIVKADQVRRTSRGLNSDEMVQGLNYKLYIENKDRHINIKNPPSKTAPQSRGERHFLVSLDELTDERLSQQGISNGIDTSLHNNRSHGYGFKYDGYLRVPRSGLYLFNVRGCDGYRIAIDNETSVEWDGIHGPEDRDFVLNLAKGDHPFAVEYFFDKGKPNFSVHWEGPGLEKRELSPSDLFHKKDVAIPELNLAILNAHKEGKAIVVNNGIVKNRPVDQSELGKPGVVTFKINVRNQGRKIEKLHLYHDDMIVAILRGDDLQKEYTCQHLLPGGEATIWTRLYYDKNHTIDTDRIPVSIGLSSVEGWKVGNAGEAAAKYNLVQTAPDAFTFLGEGEFTVNKKIKGGFTLTCKIESYAGQNREPVNRASFLGLTVRQNANIHFQRNRQSFAFRRHLHSTRTTPNFGDPGGTRCSWEAYPNDMPWLRIVRKGKANWSAWRSLDGKEWVYATTHYLPLMADEMEAGLVFSALPQDSQMYFRVEVSNVSLEPGVPDDCYVNVPPAKGTGGVTMTGVAVSVSNPDVVVIRTTDQGLLRTTDLGKTWTPANGNLKGVANAVRSVAIHPSNPEIMIRAAGYADENGQFAGGLYKTSDGGKTWTQLDFDGDFDAVGPSALCGEIVTFVQNHPKNIVIGTETKGLFASKDGGATWSQKIPAGERFTVVKCNRFGVKTGKEPMQVYALTCPDQFIPFLGRGESKFSVAEKISRAYHSINNGDNFALSRSYDDLGIYNVSFNNYNVGEYNAATSHGILFSMNRFGNYLLSNNPNLDGVRPFTAVGTSRQKSSQFSCTLTQAINPDDARIISNCGASGHIFHATKQEKAQFKGTLKIVSGDLRLTSQGNQWWVLGLDGLYYSDDECKTFKEMR